MAQNDWARTARFAACGIFLVGPIMHNWFGLLARLYPASMGHGRSMMAKVATDQLVMAPLFNPLFVTALFTMEGRPSEAWPAIKDIYVDMMLSNYKLWPAAQAVNFFFVPVQFQVLASNFIALVWNTYMSYINNQAKQAQLAE